MISEEFSKFTNLFWAVSSEIAISGGNFGSII